MPLKRTLLTLCAVTYSSLSLFAQCAIAPQTSIEGSRCTGSEIRIVSNILPESVVWKREGVVVSTQTVTLQQNGVTVAGGNGAGSNANQLNGPDRLYVDAAGNIYVPDLANNRVQKWLPGATSGITVAGGNGAGSAANQFNRPSSVFVDAQGNMYVTDQANARVQKWAPGATTGATVAGGPNGDLQYPTDVFIDKNNNMYVSDQLRQVVRKYAPGSTTGVIVAGINNSSGSGANQLSAPTGIFVDDAGTLYVADADNRRVQKWTAGATSGITLAGWPVSSLGNPLDVSVDCSRNVYVVDYTYNRVEKYPAGTTIGSIVGGFNGAGTGADQLQNPIGVFIVGNNHLYVADYSNHRVQRFSNSIDPRFTATLPGNYTVTVTYPCCPSYTTSFEIFEAQQPQTSVTATVNDICPGEEVKFFAQNTRSILAPVYQWQLNGNNIGSNSPEYTSTSLRNGDKVQCILSSTRACTIPEAATSNTIQMKVFEPIPLALAKEVFICPGNSTVLQVPAIYTSYLWQDNSTQPSLSVDKEGAYHVTVKDACNNTFSDTVDISFYRVAKNFLPADTRICTYDTLLLASSAPFISYLWNNQSTAPSLKVNQAGLYWVEVVDEHQCISSDSIQIQTKTCPPKGIYVPNGFSPNNNGANDLFKPILYGSVKRYRFAVHNRYGQLVFSTTDPTKGWNGNLNGSTASQGVYVWYCSYELEGQGQKTEKGTVVLVK